MMRARSAHQRGFTLIELIIASTTVAFLMLSLYTALHAAFKARVVMTAQADKVRSARISLDLVEQNLKSIVLPTATGIFGGPFTGTTDEIDCYTLGHDYGNDTDPLADGVRYVTVMIDSTGSGTSLVQKVTRNLLTSGAAQPVTEILATDVTAFSARYYDGSEWADSWDSTAQNNTLPMAIEVTVTVQPSPTVAAYTMTRLIPLSCGTNAAIGGT